MLIFVILKYSKKKTIQNLNHTYAKFPFFHENDIFHL